MSMADGSPGSAGAAPAKLPFGVTLGAAFAIVFDGFWMFLKALVLPVLLGIAFVLVAAVLAELSTPLMLAWQILAVLPLSILGVAYCRLALIGRQAGALPRPLFGRRTWAFFGYALLLTVICAIPILALLLLAVGAQLMAAPGMMQNPAAISRGGLAMYPVFVLAYLALMYLVTRFSLVFPAVAVDHKLSLGGSWHLTRGSNGWKLYAVLVVLYVLCINALMFLFFMSSGIFAFFMTQPEVMPHSPEEINVIGLLSYAVPTVVVLLVLEGLFFAVMVAAVASAYARLSGWTAEAAPQESFDRPG